MFTKCSTSTYMAYYLTRTKDQLNIAVLLHTDSLNTFLWVFASEFASPSFTIKPQIKINKKFKKEIPSIILTFFPCLCNATEVS